MSSETKTRDLVVTRVFDAPVAEVWRAWGDPELVKRWWGPDGFICPLAQMDFREGGTSLVCMSAPQYGFGDLYNTWTYQNMAPMQQFEFITRFTDAEGSQVAPASLGLPPDMPQDVRSLVTFRPVGDDRTEVTVTEYGYPSEQQLEMSKMGLEQCLAKMAAIFAST